MIRFKIEYRVLQNEANFIVFLQMFANLTDARE
jgi:hypothetical protein